MRTINRRGMRSRVMLSERMILLQKSFRNVRASAKKLRSRRGFSRRIVGNSEIIQIGCPQSRKLLINAETGKLPSQQSKCTVTRGYGNLARDAHRTWLPRAAVCARMTHEITAYSCEPT